MWRRSRSLIVAAALAAAVVGIGPNGSAGPPAARAATTLEICGTVSLYVKPSALLPGALTIGLIPFVVAAGATAPASLAIGQNLCVRLTLNTLGSITELVVVGVDSTTTLQLCGRVDAYAAASGSSHGSLTLAGRTFAVASGTSLPAAVTVGANLCATLQLNLFGQVKGASTTANATTILEVCGQVTAYTAAGASSTGSLTIASITRTIAPGTSVSASVHVGAIVRLRLELDGYLRISKVTVLAVGASVSGLCNPAPTASPTTQPTPTPTPNPTPNPTPTPGPLSTPGPTAGPGSSPTPGSPTPTPGGSSSSSPTSRPGSSGSPSPSDSAAPSSGPSPSAGADGSNAPPSTGPSDAPPMTGGTGGDQAVDVCPPVGGAAPISFAADLAPDASPISRAGQLMGSVAIPFAMFALGMVAMELVSWWRRRQAEQALAESEGAV